MGVLVFLLVELVVWIHYFGLLMNEHEADPIGTLRNVLVDGPRDLRICNG